MRAPQVYEIELEDRPDDVKAARRFFRDVARDLRIEDDRAEAGELALSEIVTNAIVHAGGLITVRAWKENRGLRLEVIDGDPTAPRMAKPGAPNGNGAGLPIVAAVASEWGWDDGPDGTGKRVWFTLE